MEWNAMLCYVHDIYIYIYIFILVHKCIHKMCPGTLKSPPAMRPGSQGGVGERCESSGLSTQGWRSRSGWLRVTFFR